MQKKVLYPNFFWQKSVRPHFPALQLDLGQLLPLQGPDGTNYWLLVFAYKS